MRIAIAGKNPKIPLGLAPDVDVQVVLTFGSDRSIHGKVTGDAFPHVEVFVVGPRLSAYGVCGAQMLHTFATPRVTDQRSPP